MKHRIEKLFTVSTGVLPEARGNASVAESAGGEAWPPANPLPVAWGL